MTGSSTVTSPVKRRNSKSSRSLVSRIAAPFASKQRSPVELEIRLDEPFRQYFCGDAIKGAVRLLTTRASRITHLVIRLHGFVKVVHNVRLPGETIPYDENLLTSMRRRKGIEYFGNGFARLFEDEHTLCGDGRVDSEYEFRFEFDLPSKGIPSSIDFEHGTISYLLTATLTRPTTISPTLTIHHKLNVTGTIDIAHLKAPDPRVVLVKAPSKQKKGKRQSKKRTSAAPNGKGSISSSLDENSVNGLPSPGSHANDIPPQSPAPSTRSSASTGESNSSTHNGFTNASVAGNVGEPEELDPTSAADEFTTAKTELLQGGCLPGDTLQLRISVEHTKPIKTMQGVIITVFRQGRIDTHPALPLGLSSQYEDYYPRSRTGLGGLSLTSAGSSRVFRQDLAQTIVPLIVDPHTLGANIKTSIQMPDHVFPTITCVPGSMISFKYYVQIVIDLRGKPAGQDRFLPHLSITNLPQHSYGDPKVSKIDSGDGVSYSATPGFNCLITDQLRRSKDVVFTTTEIIVGTKDSTRSKGKRKKSSVELERRDRGQDIPLGEDEPVDAVSTVARHPAMPNQDDQSVRPDSPDRGRPYFQTPAYPLPHLDEPQDEKAQIRRAEERLLPSSPPQDDEPPATSMVPTAPFAHNEEDFVHRYGFQAPAPSYSGPSSYNIGSDDSRLPQSQPQSQPHTSGPVMPAAEGVVAQDDTAQLASGHLQEHESSARDIRNHDAHEGPTTSSPKPDLDPTSQETGSAGANQISLPIRSMRADNEEPPRQTSQDQGTSPGDVPADENEPSSSSDATPSPAPTREEVEPAHTHDDHDYEDLPVYRR